MSDPEPVKLTVESWIENINKSYKSGVARIGADFTALHIKRFSSGILTLDCATGAGWPFGRIVIPAGEESTGKTLMALKACDSVTKYDHLTHLAQDRVDPDEFYPGRALFVDVENAFDMKWAKKNGFDDDWHVVAVPDYAEQAVDLVSDAITENLFDLIVIDSVAALTPTKEIELSTEDWQIGLGARLTNKAMRKWNSQLAKQSQQGLSGPCLMCLNQFRMTIGQSWGDPRVLPHGKAQRFAASIIIYTTSPKIKDDSTDEHGFVELGGVTKKNKTYTPQINFRYRMALKEHRNWKTGQVDNPKQLITLGKKYNIVVNTGNKWTVGKQEFKTLKAISGKMESDPEFERLIWRSIVQASTGALI